MAVISDVSKGTFLRFNNELVVVTDIEHRTPGNLRAFYQAKMRNVKTGKFVENRFRAGEDVEIVRVDVKDFQYLYQEGNAYVCMDLESYDQINIDAELFGDAGKFLKEEMIIKISIDGELPLLAELPSTVELEITYTEPGIRGDTATKTLKQATVETGAIVNVPLFCNIGDRIKIDTKSGDYIERAK
jgi:elongation factor P